MKIIDGLKLDGRQVEIPDCTRDDLPEFFKEMGFTVGAEIGVYIGVFSETLCKAGLKLYSIDSWRLYPDYQKNTHCSQEKMEEQYEMVKKKLAPYDCTIIRKTSMEALADIPDRSLDFVYIDGNHSFKYIAEDIFEWSKKVKKGGVVSGHDYWDGNHLFYCDVKTVVDAYVKAAHLDKLYILGDQSEGRVDKQRSWFWINT